MKEEINCLNKEVEKITTMQGESYQLKCKKEEEYKQQKEEFNHYITKIQLDLNNYRVIFFDISNFISQHQQDDLKDINKQMVELQ